MPALSFFDAARDELFRRMGFFSPAGEQGGGSPYGGQVGGPGEAERVADQARRGGAPLTAGGLMAAAGNAMGLMGSSAITTGLGSLAEQGLGLPGGMLGGIQDIPGHFKINMKGYPMNRYGFQAAMRAAERSRDPSGGARGHTGERSDRGQAGGGPRGGQQQGGGKRAF